MQFSFQRKKILRLGKPPGTTKTFIFFSYCHLLLWMNGRMNFSFFSLSQSLRSSTLTFPTATLYTYNHCLFFFFLCLPVWNHKVWPCFPCAYEYGLWSHCALPTPLLFLIWLFWHKKTLPSKSQPDGYLTICWGECEGFEISHVWMS